MREYKASTRKGQQIIERSNYFEGFKLHDVYERYSQEKQKAFDWCWNEYVNTEQSHDFHICSKNTFGFTCAWHGIKDGERIIRYETKDNSYLVWLER